MLASLEALAEQLNETHLVAVEERKSLRKGLLQMLQGLSLALPQGLLVALGAEAANVSHDFKGLIFPRLYRV